MQVIGKQQCLDSMVEWHMQLLEWEEDHLLMKFQNMKHGLNNIKYHLMLNWELKILKYKMEMIKIQKHMIHSYMKMMQQKQNNIQYMDGLNIMVTQLTQMLKLLLD